VSLSDEVDDTGALTPSSEVLFAKEVFDLLVSLEPWGWREDCLPLDWEVYNRYQQEGEEVSEKQK
jgi:hypothetical protein